MQVNAPVGGRFQHLFARRIHFRERFAGIVIAVLERTFKQSRSRRAAVGRQREHQALAVFPSPLFHYRQSPAPPHDVFESHRRVGQLARLPVKRRILQEQSVTHRNILARIASITRFHPKNRGRCVASPFELARPGCDRIVNVRDRILKRLIHQLLARPGCQVDGQYAFGEKWVR